MTDPDHPAKPRDRAMALLLEMQAGERSQVNEAELRLLADVDSRKAREHQALVDLVHPKVDDEGDG